MNDESAKKFFTGVLIFCLFIIGIVASFLYGRNYGADEAYSTVTSSLQSIGDINKRTADAYSRIEDRVSELAGSVDGISAGFTDLVYQLEHYREFADERIATVERGNNEIGIRISAIENGQGRDLELVREGRQIVDKLAEYFETD